MITLARTIISGTVLLLQCHVIVQCRRHVIDNSVFTCTKLFTIINFNVMTLTILHVMYPAGYIQCHMHVHVLVL